MDMEQLYSKYGVTVASNVGRRNNSLSWVHEHLVAVSLGVTSDGRTGHPDMLVDGHPIECRIGSPRSNRGMTLSSSWSTLRKHPIADYVYIVLTRDATSFAFLHVPDVVEDDFKPMTSPNQHKAYLRRTAVVDRVRCLHGVMEVKGDTFRLWPEPL